MVGLPSTSCVNVQPRAARKPASTNAWRRRRRYDRAMNTVMFAALPATARPTLPSMTTDDPDLTRAGLTREDADRVGEALAAAHTPETRRQYNLVWGQW